MFEAILFDLDGTLLPLEIDKFLSGYLQALASKVRLDPVAFSGKLLSSTQKMIESDGSRTNREVFDADFFPGLSRDRRELERLIDEFYREDFPKLKAGLTPNPAAREAVSAAFACTERVVVATNPVFPRSAILERMRWAGIADFPYALITSYENMHWAKPNLHYYLEIARQLGVSPQETLMVGNDVQEDLVSAKVGMKTFLVDEMLIHRSGDAIFSHWRGSMAQCAEFLRKMSKEGRVHYGCN